MKTLDYPSTGYLLDVSVDSLHAESLHWLKEIDFWKDEMTFFYHLLHKKNTVTDFPTEELALIEKELVHFNSEQLDKLKKEIHHHEQLLVEMMRSLSPEARRNLIKSHQELSLKIFNVSELVRDIKRTVFSFVQKY